MSYCCRLPFAFDSFDGVLPASSACFPLWVFSGYLFVPGARWKVLRCICLSWVSSSFGVFLRRPPCRSPLSPHRSCLLSFRSSSTALHEPHQPLAQSAPGAATVHLLFTIVFRLSSFQLNFYLSFHLNSYLFLFPHFGVAFFSNILCLLLEIS
jgi:hypothetical protein